MKSLITEVVIKMLVPLFLLFSFYMLFRGHDQPGGGFIGGLTGSIVFILYGMIHGAEATRKVLRFDPLKLIVAGLAVAVVSGSFSLIIGDPYMSALWSEYYLPFFGKPGTPILFDVGVYLLVIGVILKITFTILED